MSGAQQFGTIASGIGSLLGARKLTTGGSGHSGFLGLLGRVSDRRLKEEISPVGTLFDGTPVYGFPLQGSASLSHWPDGTGCGENHA